MSCLYRLDLGDIKVCVEFLLDSIAWDNIPRVWLLLKNLNFQTIDWFFLEWGLTLFVKNFPLNVSGFIFDQIFLNGDVSVYVAAVAAIALLEERICAESDVEGVRRVIGTDVIDAEGFMKAFHEVHVSETVKSLISQPNFFGGRTHHVPPSPS